MNYNRRRNIFTLGDFHQYPNPTQQIKAQLNRRQNSDPFERDPFKIQSYNFRYAERPSYPLPNWSQNNHHRHTTHQPSTSSATSSINKRFETFFYNYDFAPSVHDKENPTANKFRECRRRKFLLDHQQQQHPTTTGLYAQTTTSRREPSTLQHHQNLYQQQQQLHPLANSAAIYARSASQTALESAAALNVGGRMRSNNSHHQPAFASATDTSSNVTTPHRSNSHEKRSGASSARSTGNREYLRALATAHIGATANDKEANFPGRGRRSGRPSPSLERGRLTRAEPLSTNNNIFSQTYGNARGAGYRELSGARASPTKYATARQPQHTASPHRVTATVEKTEGACSGCQININIKGLESSQLGDNVVIKIESDKNTPVKTSSRTEELPAVLSALNNIYSGVGVQQQQHGGSGIAYAKLMEVKRSAELNQNLDNKPKSRAQQLPPLGLRNSSSANFVIDKRLSKFAITSNDSDARGQRKHMPRSSSHSRIPVTSSNTRALGLTASTTALRSTNSSENMQRNTRTASKERVTRSASKERIARNTSTERMPSMVPWCLDNNVCQGGSGSNADTKSLRAKQSSNLLKQMRTSYDATLNDVREKRRQAVLAAYKPLTLPRCSMSPSAPQTRKVESYDANGWRSLDKTTPEKNSTGNELKRRQSHHSLGSVKAGSKSTLQSQTNSQWDLNNSPTIIMRRSKSCLGAQDISAARHAANSQSHLSVNTTPLNVNINVFADKLRLLRV